MRGRRLASWGGAPACILQFAVSQQAGPSVCLASLALLQPPNPAWQVARKEEELRRVQESAAAQVADADAQLSALSEEVRC